ncbi:MAG TPA: hypothetical protein VIP05_22910 [Burkholderiaceae bacterium]
MTTIAQVGSPTLFGDTSSATATGTRTAAEGSLIVVTIQSGDDLTQGTPDGWFHAGVQGYSDAPNYQTNVYYYPNHPGGEVSFTAARAAAGTLKGTMVEWAGMGAATLFTAIGFGGYGTGPGSAFASTGTLPAAVCLVIGSFYAAASSFDTLTGPDGFDVIESSNAGPEYMIAALVTADDSALAPYWTVNVNVANANLLTVFVPGSTSTTYTLTLLAATTAGAALVRAVSVARAAGVSASATSRKVVAATRIASTTIAGAITSSAVRLLTLSASTSALGAATRGVFLTRAAAVTLGAASSKGIARTLAATSNLAASVVPSTVLTLVLLASTSVRGAASRTVGKTLAAAASTSADLLTVLREGTALALTKGFEVVLAARAWTVSIIKRNWDSNQ